MKKILFVLSILFCALASAQTEEDQGRISIKALMPDESDLTTNASSQLETKMQRLLADNGYADDKYAARFIMTAKVDVISKDIAPSTPPRVSEKIDVTFFVGDIIENKVYASVTIKVTGVGINENKAQIAAINNVNPRQQKLKEMLSDAKSKIVDYYTNNCNEQIMHAKTMASLGNYDQAIAYLMSVPNISSECFNECQQTSINIYQQKIDAEGLNLFEKAKNAWLKNSNYDGAVEVVSIINEIPINSSVYPQVEELRKKIKDKLDADEQRKLEQEQHEWDFKMKQYNDAQSNKQMAIKACRDISVAWAKNQPKNITQAIIRGWW